ncbi:MAG TPA: S8 family serine peptidase [Methanotrichaceae archaeon]|nr:S8 family serine peptidase [Methanotrichaceae archaeon]
MSDKYILRGRPAVIALIDSGIDTRKCGLGRLVKMSTGFSVKDGYIVEDKERSIKSEHATALSLVIREIAGDAEFISINILNERLATDFRVLLYAMYYVLDELRPDVIHLSLGTTKLSHYLPLREIVKKAKARDLLLVASADNSIKISFPAFMKGVLGVKSSFDMSPQGYGYDGRFFRASPSLEGISGSGCLDRQDYRGNSIAAAYITGHIAKIVRRDGWTGSEMVLAKLIQQSMKMGRRWGF